jgi:hypothetical protein
MGGGISNKAAHAFRAACGCSIPHLRVPGLHALAIGAFTRGKASRVMTYLSFIIAFAPIVSARLN